LSKTREGYGKTFRDIMPEKCEILVFIKNEKMIAQKV
jgi:hypothetical protein